MVAIAWASGSRFGHDRNVGNDSATAGRSHQNIAGLKVAMNDAVILEQIQSPGDSLDDLRCRTRGGTAAWLLHHSLKVGPSINSKAM